MRKSELLQMPGMEGERETYRKDKVPTLKGPEPSGGTDRKPMTQQSLASAGEGCKGSVTNLQAGGEP